MKILETSRLLLEQATLADADFIFKLLNSPNWIEFIGDRGIKTQKDAEAYIEKSLINAYEKYGYGLYKMSLKEESIPVGLCGFVKRDYLDHADIGFAILPDYDFVALSGKGFTYEAAKATLEYGRNHLNVEPVLAITTEGNIKSQKLLLKLGLSAIGTISPNKDETEFLLFSTIAKRKPN